MLNQPMGFSSLRWMRHSQRKEKTLHESVGLKLILAASYSPTTRCGSTITAEGLNCCVRDGNRCLPFAIATKKTMAFYACCVNVPSKLHNASQILRLNCRSSPRTISTGQLKTSLPLHTRPIYLIVYEGSYQINSVGDLILRSVSRLDAFSAYPVRTWLSSHAPGGTTGKPAVRPSRSSRTRDRSSQISYAHDR